MSEILLNGALMAISIATFGYLLYALFFPERF